MSGRRRRPPSAGKKLSQQTFIGQEGVNLIEKRVLAMGFWWEPRGAVEAGIDGHIELRDAGSGEMLNRLILVQSKATREAFFSETSTSLDYVCDERDLNYWMMGNAPVILVRSRPDTDEAYWVSIKDNFKDPPRRKQRKIRFDKEKDRFDLSAKPRLLELGLSRDDGIYFTPEPRREKLYANLLRVTGFGKSLYLAEALHEALDDILAVLKAETKHPAREWLFKNNRILSFHDLHDPPWNKVCDLGTIETFGSEEWAESDDPDRRRDFVYLLNKCLGAKVRPLGVRYDKQQGYYHFMATRNLQARKIRYRSLQNNTTREVFGPHLAKDDVSRVSYYRHSAFEGYFRRYGEEWFLEIVPTYHFTTDGYLVHRFYESKLKGIKALENNAAVLGQVAMWANLLGERRGDLFTQSYPFLQLGQLLTFDAESGVDDKLWIMGEEGQGNVEANFVDDSTDDLPLFTVRNDDED